VKLALRFGLSIALVALLFAYVVDGHEMLRILRQLAPGYLLLALVIVTLDRILMTYKWLLLLRALGHRLSLVRGVMIYCASMVWGLALPATVGADAIRAVMASRRGMDGTEVVTSIVIERIVGFVLALALGVVSLFVLRSIGVLDARFDVALLLGIALLVGAIATVIVSMNKTVVASLVARLPGVLRRSKAMEYVQRFSSAYQSLGAARSTIARFGVLTVIEQLFCIVYPWVLALGLGIHANLLVLLGALPISTLISRLPVSFDGIGVFEALFVGLLVMAGISAEGALAIAIAGRIIQLIAFLPWWLAQVASSGAVGPPQPLSPR
jgi:uncharacterized protein (TIRG00374 family)